MKHTPTKSACKLFYKEHFVGLLDQLRDEFAEFVQCAHVHDDTDRHPMSDVDFVNFARGLRHFSDCVVTAEIGFFHAHPEATELLKRIAGHAEQTNEEILKQVWESLQRTAANATGQALDNDLDQAEDEV